MGYSVRVWVGVPGFLGAGVGFLGAGVGRRDPKKMHIGENKPAGVVKTGYGTSVQSRTHHREKQTMDSNEMIQAALKSGGQYACLQNYEASSGSCSTYYLRLGVTRGYALEQSILWADSVDFKALANMSGVDESTARVGLAEQVASWKKSLQGMQRADNFETVAASKGGRRIFSLKTDKDGNQLREKGLYFNAMREGSVVHVQGTPKPGPKSAIAIVKAYIRRKAPIGSFRTYNLRADNFECLTFGNEVLTSADIVPVVASL